VLRIAQNEAFSEQSSEKNNWRYVKAGAIRMTNITYRELAGSSGVLLYQQRI
jgi:hypothetical protein